MIYHKAAGIELNSGFAACSQMYKIEEKNVIPIMRKTRSTTNSRELFFIVLPNDLRLFE